MTQVQEALLEIEALSAHYGEMQALFGVNLRLVQGEVIALIGANGAGKSTLLRSIAGLTTMGGGTRLTGSIRFNGQRIEALLPDRVVAHGIALVPEGRRLFARMSVEDNLLCGAYLPALRAGARARLDEVFSIFPRLAERRRQIVTQMSGGEQQMVAIGRALMSRPRLLLLDEVSLGLSPAMVGDLYANLDRLRGQVSIIAVEQDLGRALGFADRAAVMLEGRIVLEGDAAGLDREDITAAYFGTSRSQHADVRTVEVTG